jgi:hypothetical protein
MVEWKYEANKSFCDMVDNELEFCVTSLAMCPAYELFPLLRTVSAFPDMETVDADEIVEPDVVFDTLALPLIVTDPNDCSGNVGAVGNIEPNCTCCDILRVDVPSALVPVDTICINS